MRTSSENSYIAVAAAPTPAPIKAPGTAPIPKKALPIKAPAAAPVPAPAIILPPLLSSSLRPTAALLCFSNSMASASDIALINCVSSTLTSASFLAAAASKAILPTCPIAYPIAAGPKAAIAPAAIPAAPPAIPVVTAPPPTAPAPESDGNILEAAVLAPLRAPRS